LKQGKWLIVAAATVVAALALSACGSSKKKTTSAGGATSGGSLTVSIAETGKTAKFTAPSSAKGGVVTLRVTNSGKVPHGAQLALIGDHTPQEVFTVLGADKPKVPDWLRAEGGLGSVPPGQTQTATLDLPAGKYVLFDPPNGPGGGGPPAYTKLTVGAGSRGALPSTPATVTADQVGKDKYRWDVSGELKNGVQDVTFVSKGKDALHFLGAFRVTGNPSDADLKKVFKQGKPPKFVDQGSDTTSAVIDGGKSQVLPLTLKAPGTWVLYCAVTDREGGKPHFEEGLLEKVQVK
jgi:hypothetical protein